jgi:anti-sigma factor RsiW
VSDAVLPVNAARAWDWSRQDADASDGRGRPPRGEGTATDTVSEDHAGRPGDDGPGLPGAGFSLPTFTRRHAAFAVGALVAAWIAIVIGRAVADSAAVNDRAAELRIENAQLEQRLEASRREVALVQSPAYVRLEARAFGFGRNGERAFSLDPGAPAPPRIRLLGTDPRDEVARPPLEDWIELLFGAG